MKTKSIVLFVVLLIASVRLAGAADNPSEALQKGLLEEEANHNLDAAIQAYQTVLNQFDNQRKIAATAVFRLGECYRKLGKTNEAVAQYQRVVQDFSDQDSLVGPSERNLAALGRGNGPGGSGTISVTTQTVTDPDQLKLLKEEIKLVEKEIAATEARLKVGKAEFADIAKTKKELFSLQRQLPENAGSAVQRSLIDEQIQLVERLLAEKKKRVEVGAAPPLDTVPLEKELLGMKRELIAISKGPSTARGPDAAYAAASEEEAKEIQRLKAVLQNSPDLVNARSGFDYTPLHVAALKGQRTVAEYLLAHGADVDAKTTEANTPLHFATLAGHKGVVELLLAHGAEVNSRNRFKAAPLHIAAAKGYKVVAEVLLAHHADINAISESASVTAEFGVGESHQYWTVSVAAGAPMHSAVIYGGMPMIECLLANKADLKAGQTDVGTPLYWAATGGWIVTARRLVEGGAEINAKMGSGWTPLHSAVVHYRVEMAQWLLANGADVNAADEDGFTPLHLATRAGNEPAAELLLQNRADINAKDHEGATPLHLAVEGGNAKMVKFLLAKGADRNAKDSSGATPSDWLRRGARVKSTEGNTMFVGIANTVQIGTLLEEHDTKQ